MRISLFHYQKRNEWRGIQCSCRTLCVTLSLWSSFRYSRVLHEWKLCSSLKIHYSIIIFILIQCDENLIKTNGKTSLAETHHHYGRWKVQEEKDDELEASSRSLITLQPLSPATHHRIRITHCSRRFHENLPD